MSIVSKKATLNPKQRRFADEYLRNGFNATQAYRVAYPMATYASCQRAGWVLLRNVVVARYVGERMDAAAKALQMGGEEALARLAAAARLNVADFLDEDGDVLEPKDWPADLAGCVKAFQMTEDGIRMTFTDPQAAQRIILEQTGKLKTVGDSFDALAEAIRADLSRGTPKGR